MSILKKIVDIISKNRFLTITMYIVNNYYQHIKLKITPKKTSNSARSTVKFDLKKELDKAKQEFLLYKEFGTFKNKSILEIGPGAYSVNPLFFLKEGAKQYVAVDLYYCLREPENTKLMKETINEFTKEEMKNIDQGYDIKNNKFKKKYYKYIQTDITKLQMHNKFDYIISYATLEHIEDMEHISQACKKLLKKNGSIISMVGNNDHGMFNKEKYSKYEYYTINKFIYKHMTKLSGRPNRYTPEEYIDCFQRNKFTTTNIYAHRTFENEYCETYPNYKQVDIKKHAKLINTILNEQKRFCKEYKTKNPREFIFDFFVLVAKK